MNHENSTYTVLDVPPSLPRSIFMMMAYTVVSLGLYAYASYELQQEAIPLQSRCEELQARLLATHRSTKELAEIVGSLSDPAADEYALITELGRIPEGCRVMLLSPVSPEGTS
jgi:hypothetical protein